MAREVQHDCFFLCSLNFFQSPTLDTNQPRRCWKLELSPLWASALLEAVGTRERELLNSGSRHRELGCTRGSSSAQTSNEYSMGTFWCRKQQDVPTWLHSHQFLPAGSSLTSVTW